MKYPQAISDASPSEMRQRPRAWWNITKSIHSMLVFLVLSSSAWCVTDPDPNIPSFPVVSTRSLLSGAVGCPYLATLNAYNIPTSWQAIGLPSWLNLNAQTGVLSGTPSASGTYAFSVTATNAAGTSVTQSLGLVVTGTAPMKIMPLGDSLTAGLHVQADSRGGYRYNLYRQLRNANRNTLMVGSYAL